MRVQDEKTKAIDGAVSRRKVLLGGTTLAAATAMGSAGPFKRRKRSSSVPQPCLLRFLPIRSVKSP